MANSEEEARKSVPLVWIGLEDLPVRTATNIVSQFQDDLFIVNVGFANPPILTGTPEEVRQKVESLDSVPVTPVVRLGLTESAMRSFASVLQENLKRFEAAKDSETED